MTKNEKISKAGNKSTRTATPTERNTVKSLKKQVETYRICYEAVRELYNSQKDLRTTDHTFYKSLYDFSKTQNDSLQAELKELRAFRNSIVELSLKQL
jgi:hypothetical protein